MIQDVLGVTWLPNVDPYVKGLKPHYLQLASTSIQRFSVKRQDQNYDEDEPETAARVVTPCVLPRCMAGSLRVLAYALRTRSHCEQRKRSHRFVRQLPLHAACRV
jgi:hypothetical protein